MASSASNVGASTGSDSSSGMKESKISSIVGGIKERAVGEHFLHSLPAGSDKLASTGSRGFPDVFRVDSAADASGAQSVFKQRLLAARSRRQTERPARTDDRVSAEWLAGAGAAIGLDPTDVAALDAGNASRVVAMSSDERQGALEEVRSLLSEDVLRKWMAKKKEAAAVGTAPNAAAAVQAAQPTSASALQARVPSAPVTRGPLDLSHITNEEELDQAAAQLLPPSERAKLAWTGLFDAEGQPSTSEEARRDGAVEDELAAYSWTAGGAAGGRRLEEEDEDNVIDSQLIRMMAAAGTAQLFTLWARAAAQAAAAEDDVDEERYEEEEEDGSLGTTRRGGVKIPAPEPLTTDTAMAHWASLRDTLGLTPDQAVVDPAAAGVKLRIHPSGRQLRFDLSGRLVRAAWAETSSQQDAAALAIAAGLHHHGEDEEKAGYCLIEILGLARSTSHAQRALAMNMLAGVLESRHAAFVGTPLASKEEDAALPWRYPADQWPAEARMLRTLLLPPAVPVIVASALRDTSRAVLRPALTAVRAFMCGTAPHEVLSRDALSLPVIRAQPPIDEEGDAGRLLEGHAAHHVTQAILNGAGRKAERQESAAVQALRTGRAALVDPCAVLCRGQYGLLQQVARLVQGMVGQTGEVQLQALPELMECLHILEVCASRSPSIATCVGRSLTIALPVPGRSQRVSVGLLPWLLHATLHTPGHALRTGAATDDAVRVASAALRLLLCILRQGSSFARDVCDAAGRGGGLGRGSSAATGADSSVSPVYLDALLQFAPLEGSRVPLSIQCLVLDILCTCLVYGLGMDRVSTLWMPHLQGVLQGREGAGQVYRQVHAVVRLFCRQASRVAHLSALSLSDERAVSQTASMQQAANDAVSLCREARAMANTALAQLLQTQGDVENDVLLMSLLVAYVSVDHPQQIALQAAQDPDGQERLIEEARDDERPSLPLPFLHDVLLQAGGKTSMVRRILHVTVLPAIQSSSLHTHAHAAMHDGDIQSARWLTIFCQLLTQLHGLDADTVHSSVQHVKSLCLEATTGLAIRAGIVRSTHDEGEERACGVAGRQAMPSAYWPHCQPGHRVAVQVQALGHAAAAMLTLSHRLHEASPALISPAIHLLSVCPADSVGSAVAVSAITHILLSPPCLQKQGRAADMLGMKGGLLPLWYSTLCRVPLSPFNFSTEIASWPRPARAAWHRAAILLPGLLLPIFNGSPGAESELQSLAPWVPSVPLLSEVEADGGDEGHAQGEEQEGSDQHSEGVAALCTGLPRPLRINPGVPCSMPRLVRSAVCCPLYVLGCLDKLRSGTSGSAVHAGLTPPQADHQEKEVILRPLRAVLQWMAAVGVHAVFGFPSSSIPRERPPTQTHEEYSLVLAHCALEACLLLFALLHVPLADVDAETGRSLCVAMVEVYSLFRQCSPGACLLDILGGHPGIGVHVLQALAQGLMEGLAQEGPGSAGGALDVAILILMTPSSAPVRPAQQASPLGTEQTTTLRPFLWKALGESGVGHMVGELDLGHIPHSALSALLCDLTSGSARADEEEVHAIVSFLRQNMTGHAAGGGKLPGPWKKIDDTHAMQRRAHLCGTSIAPLLDGEEQLSRRLEGAHQEVGHWSTPTAYQLALQAMGRQLWTQDMEQGRKLWARMELEQLHSVVRLHVLQTDVS